MKNIDTDRLKAEIEKRIKSAESCPFIEAEFGAGERREGKIQAYNEVLTLINTLQQEQPKVDLEKFTEKMNDWKARYNYPDNIQINATMAFTARMFYMYPDIARQWYDSLPKATQD